MFFYSVDEVYVSFSQPQILASAVIHCILFERIQPNPYVAAFTSVFLFSCLLAGKTALTADTLYLFWVHQ